MARNNRAAQGTAVAKSFGVGQLNPVILSAAKVGLAVRGAEGTIPIFPDDLVARTRSFAALRMTALDFATAVRLGADALAVAALRTLLW
jgi:hypothetical protein